jgi:hypothetical protein
MIVAARSRVWSRSKIVVWLSVSVGRNRGFRIGYWRRCRWQDEATTGEITSANTLMLPPRLTITSLHVSHLVSSTGFF